VETARLVLTDTNVLLNLALVNRMDLLGAFPDLRFCAPREVLGEVLRPRERALVDQAVACGLIQKMALEPVEALSLFSKFLQLMGRGEAACLALAVHHRALVASDEKRAFRREADRHLGPGCILNTPGLLVLAIRRNLISLGEADEIKLALEENRFRMTFRSFADIL